MYVESPLKKIPLRNERFVYVVDTETQRSVKLDSINFKIRREDIQNVNNPMRIVFLVFHFTKTGQRFFGAENVAQKGGGTPQVAILFCRCCC